MYHLLSMGAEQNGKKRELSPEARDKLSRLAKERHARGEFGGPKFGRMGGRPRKKRVAERVAEAAQRDEMARDIIKVFQDAIDDSQPISIRLKGAMALHEIERDEARTVLKEVEQDAKQHSRDELISILSDKLTSGTTAAILRRQLEAEAIPDADVVEDDG